MNIIGKNSQLGVAKTNPKQLHYPLLNIYKSGG